MAVCPRPSPIPPAHDIAQALAVLDEHMAALNAQDNARLTATLHFPHYRLAGGRMQVWEKPDTYLADFHKRAGPELRTTRCWDFRNVIVAGEDKIHFDVQFTRYRADNSVLGPIPLAVGRGAARRPLGRADALDLCRVRAAAPQQRLPVLACRTQTHDAARLS